LKSNYIFIESRSSSINKIKYFYQFKKEHKDSINSYCYSGVEDTIIINFQNNHKVVFYSKIIGSNINLKFLQELPVKTSKDLNLIEVYYYNVNNTADGGHYFYFSEKLGLIKISSATWNSSLNLYSVNNKNEDILINQIQNIIDTIKIDNINEVY
jgi:hypothetical protein